MRYTYSKSNLIIALDRLKHYVEDNFVEDGKRNNIIRPLFEGVEDAMQKAELEFPDCFGTEGYEHSILEKD